MIELTDFDYIEQGDCLELMKDIPDGSIDMILCDLPYGTTACKWDTIIPFEPLWEQYDRVIKDNGAVVLFCQQPFTSYIISSNVSKFKYMWYWRKSRPSGFTNAKLKPLKDIEEIAVFSNGNTANGSKNNMVYNPQGTNQVNIKWSRPKSYTDGDKGVSPARKNSKLDRIITRSGYPRQILEFANSNKGLLHPTQKPVPLLEYLIKTYTNEGEIVLDNCMGSGSTCVAAINTNRHYIGFELDKEYYETARKRIENTEREAC